MNWLFSSGYIWIIPVAVLVVMIVLLFAVYCSMRPYPAIEVEEQAFLPNMDTAQHTLPMELNNPGETARQIQEAARELARLSELYYKHGGIVHFQQMLYADSKLKNLLYFYRHNFIERSEYERRPTTRQKRYHAVF